MTFGQFIIWFGTFRGLSKITFLIDGTVFCFSPQKKNNYHLHIPKICFNLYHICCLGYTTNNQKYFHFTFSNQLHFKAKIVKFLQIFESKWYILCQITFLQFHSLKWHVTSEIAQRGIRQSNRYTTHFISCICNTATLLST